MAMAVAEASMQLLEVSRVKVRAIHREADVRARLLALWGSACSWEGTACSRLLGADGAGDEAVAAKAARDLAAAVPFLCSLDRDDSAWQEQVLESVAILAAEGATGGSAASSPEAEPVVAYAWEAALCCTPPAEVALPTEFPGSLIWGGLSHALHADWLRWRRVTHVVCCLGSRGRDGPNPDYVRAQEARSQSSGIVYYDWCVNNHWDRVRFLSLFAYLTDVLRQEDCCVFVHCRSGRDRSAFTVYSLLRVSLGMDDATSRAVVAQRRDTHSRPLANLDQGHEGPRAWLEKVLRRADER
jgi:hypothetical protein